jgi:hypothetical protein
LVKPEVKAKPSEKGFHCTPQKRSRLYAYANLLCPMFESVLVLWWLGCNWLLYCCLWTGNPLFYLHADYSARRIDFLFECRVQKYYYSAEKRQKMPKIAPHNSQKSQFCCICWIKAESKTLMIWRYYIASELAKRDGQLPLQCNISCPRRTALVCWQLCPRRTAFVGGRPLS